MIPGFTDQTVELKHQDLGLVGDSVSKTEGEKKKRKTPNVNF